jgi:hypothetical protein
MLLRHHNLGYGSDVNLVSSAFIGLLLFSGQCGKIFSIKKRKLTGSETDTLRVQELRLFKKTSCKILFKILQLRYAMGNMGSKVYTGWNLPMILLSIAGVTSGII